MKKFKKIFAAIAASALVAAMSFTSMAASITINSTAASGTTDNTTYTYYKILNADILYNKENEIQSVSYYIDSEDKKKLHEEIAKTGLFDVKMSADGSRWIVEAKNANTITAEEIITAFNNEAILDKALGTGTFKQAKVTEGETSTVKAVADVSDGYYLIKSSLGTVLAVQTTGNKGVVIDEKNAYPSLTKTEDKETASYGDKIKYTVNVSIPASAAAKDIKVVDTMSTGLTPFDGDDDNLLDVTAKVGETVLSGTEAVTVSNNDKAINITIPAVAVDKYKGQIVTLTYQAVLNNNAQPTTAESNTAYLVYANYTSLKSTVSVTTYGFELTKVDGAKKNTTDRFIPATAGDAEFTLYKTEDGDDKIYVELKDEASNTYQITTTETSTKILAGGVHHDATIVGLAKGTYYLQEDKAPTGYNKLAKRQAIAVAEKAVSENKVDVENNAGIKLPSTGGMGTTVFAIVGLLVMAGAAVTLIVKKRA